MSTEPSKPAALEPAPYTDRHVDVGGLKLHVQDYGTAGKPQMLCVHGSAAHAHWFDFVASGLNDDYHVLAPDQRGHGDSEWDLSAHPEYNYDRYAADLHELRQRGGRVGRSAAVQRGGEDLPGHHTQLQQVAVAVLAPA